MARGPLGSLPPEAALARRLEASKHGTAGANPERKDSAPLWPTCPAAPSEAGTLLRAAPAVPGASALAPPAAAAAACAPAGSAPLQRAGRPPAPAPAAATPAAAAAEAAEAAAPEAPGGAPVPTCLVHPPPPRLSCAAAPPAAPAASPAAAPAAAGLRWGQACWSPERRQPRGCGAQASQTPAAGAGRGRRQEGASGAVCQNRPEAVPCSSRPGPPLPQPGTGSGWHMRLQKPKLGEDESFHDPTGTTITLGIA